MLVATKSVWIMGVSMFEPWCGFSIFWEKCYLICLKNWRFGFRPSVMGEQPWLWEIGLLLEQSSCDIGVCPLLFFFMWIWVRGWMYGVLLVVTVYSTVTVYQQFLWQERQQWAMCYWQKEGIATAGYVHLGAIWRTCSLHFFFEQKLGCLPKFIDKKNNKMV